MSKEDFTDGIRDEIDHPVVNKFIGSNTTRESRSKRFQMLLKPSMFRALQKEAAMKEVSMNQIVNQILKAHQEKSEMR